MRLQRARKHEQGRPVRALCDAEIHHGQIGGNEKPIKYVKTRKFYEIRGGICKSRGIIIFLK